LDEWIQQTAPGIRLVAVAGSCGICRLYQLICRISFTSFDVMCTSPLRR